MSKLIIPAGQVPKGTVEVSGAKNSATRLICAALLTDEDSTLANIPTELVDLRNKITFLTNCGIVTHVNSEEDELLIKPSSFKMFDDDLANVYNVPVRTTYLLAAMQILRQGFAKIPYPGGCNLGDRKYDLHIMVWEKFGCLVEERQEYIYIKARNGKLQPCEINFPISTIGGTENALLCASITEGRTLISNAYVSPEVLDLISLLRQMGVVINLQGNGAIEIYGRETLKGVNYKVMPDRIEALTWMVYGVLSGGDLLIKNVPFNSMEIPLMHINAAGVDFFKNSTDIYINGGCIGQNGIDPFEVACGTHPGVISDMQPFFTLLALGARGRSLIVDYRYPERTAYLDELNKLIDSKIEYTSGRILVNGPVKFISGSARSTDLRGSMAVILAALLVKTGVDSVIENPELALRGYNKLLDKLNKLGVYVTYRK